MKTAIMMVETVVDLVFWKTNVLNVHVLVELLLETFWLETWFAMTSLTMMTVTTMEETVVSSAVIINFMQFVILSFFKDNI